MVPLNMFISTFTNPTIYSIVNTSTFTTSMLLIKIYLKFHKNTPTYFRSDDHHQGGL